MANRIRLRSGTDNVTFFGNGAFVCNILLNLRNSADPLVGSILDTTIFKGSLAIGGFLFVCQKHIYFVPKNVIHRSFGRPYFRLKIHKIQNIRIEKNKTSDLLIITAIDQSWKLSCSSPILYQSVLAKDISTCLSLRKKRSGLASKKARLLYKERIQYMYKDSIQFGYCILTQDEFSFEPETGSSLSMSLPIEKISSLEASSKGLDITVDDNIFTFRSIDPELIEILREKISNCQRPKELKDAKGGMKISEITGNGYSAIINIDEKENIPLPFLKIISRSDRLQLLLSEFPNSEKILSDTRFSIDIAKDMGRFFFRGRIRAFKKENSSPLVQAILTLDKPDNIFRHSLREDFRMPMIQHTFVQNFFCKSDDQEELDISIQDFMGKSCPYSLQNPAPIQVNNISMSGCQLTLPFKPPEKWVRDGLYVSFPLMLQNKEQTMRGKFIYSSSNPKNPKEIINGIQFDRIQTDVKKSLISHILEIERVALRKLKGTSLDSDKFKEEIKLLNPMLRSAMKLIQTSAFSNLSIAEAAQFLASGTIKPFDIGEVLIREGDIGDTFFVLTEGELEVRTGKTFLARLHPGAAVGEMALIDPAPRAATVRAKTNGALIEITRKTFEQSVANGNQTSLKVLQSLSRTVMERMIQLNTSIRLELNKKDEISFSQLLEQATGQNK